ncbi:MAG: hypothetical protein O7D30_11135 [Rickettsia endosymbiont of Ixodes persulcatus]|nr:hypothetical protein [Rickettsia endosymbiont of Ixodes persulcatus]
MAMGKHWGDGNDILERNSRTGTATASVADTCASRCSTSGSNLPIASLISSVASTKARRHTQACLEASPCSSMWITIHCAAENAGMLFNMTGVIKLFDLEERGLREYSNF